jgi:hypothetical protein
MKTPKIKKMIKFKKIRKKTIKPIILIMTKMKKIEKKLKIRKRIKKIQI